jgi:class 3 adenylate cyclase
MNSFATKVLSKVFSSQSAAFLSRQAVRDQYYVLLRQMGEYLATKGEAGKKVGDYMYITFTDSSPSRDYGKIGPVEKDLQALQAYIKAAVAQLEVVTSPSTGMAPQLPSGTALQLPNQYQGPVTAADIGGVPLWLIAAAGIAALVFMTRK